MNKADKILEVYRRSRTLQNIVSKDEGEPDEKLRLSPSARKEWNKSMDFWKNKARKDAAQDRLKKKGAIPSKDGKKMFEEYKLLEEDFSKFMSMFRKYYYSGKMMRFRDWLEIMEDMIDAL